MNLAGSNAQRFAVPAFMAAVTAYLVGRVLSEAATGLEGSLEVVAYSVAAAFGLDFVAGSWRSLWAGRPRRT